MLGGVILRRLYLLSWRVIAELSPVIPARNFLSGHISALRRGLTEPDVQRIFAVGVGGR